MLSVALGSVVAPEVVAHLGVRAALAVVGLVLPVLAVVSSRLLNQVDKASPVTDRFGLVDGVPIFAPLPLATKERLAGALVPVHASPGQVLVRAGDAGESFYIVASGRLAIERGGSIVATTEEGGYFGEIALMDNVPRTASVMALVGSDLYQLDRDTFLAVVTGNPVALNKARGVVAQRRPRDGA